MLCNCCGSQLVRGFSYCLQCGAPVPAEMMEESGLPIRKAENGVDDAFPQENGSVETAPPAEEEVVEELMPQLQGDTRDIGGELTPQYIGGEEESESGAELKAQLIGSDSEESGEALKPQLIGSDEETGGGEKVKASLQESSAAASDNVVEKLLFCPNCGMHMQKNPTTCEICGMPLGEAPVNIPTTSGGIPLFNTESNLLSGDFGGLGGITDTDVGIDGLITEQDSLFGDNSLFNTQAPQNSYTQAAEQLASFSAGGIPAIEVTENTRIRQKEPESGVEREVIDFSMTDDLSSESIPLYDGGMPVVGDYSMEDNPNDDLVIDPYAFIHNSMDEYAPAPAASEPSRGPAPITPPEMPKREEPRPAPNTEPPTPPVPELDKNFNKDFNKDFNKEDAAEEQPVIEEFDTSKPSKPVQQAAKSENKPQTRLPDPPNIAPEKPAAQPQRPTTKTCYACGRVMPISDKFCPECGRSTFGQPNPELILHAPPPQPKKKKPPIAIIVIAIVIVIIVAVVIAVNAKGAEILSTEQAVQNTAAAVSSVDSNFLL